MDYFSRQIIGKVTKQASTNFRQEIILSIFSDHNAVKVEISNKKNGKFQEPMEIKSLFLWAGNVAYWIKMVKPQPAMVLPYKHWFMSSYCTSNPSPC